MKTVARCMLIIAFMMTVFVGFARAEDTYGALE